MTFLFKSLSNKLKSLYDMITFFLRTYKIIFDEFLNAQDTLIVRLLTFRRYNICRRVFYMHSHTLRIRSRSREMYIYDKN